MLYVLCFLGGGISAILVLYIVAKVQIKKKKGAEKE